VYLSYPSCELISNTFQIENIIGGMRGLKAMLWEASVLDANEVRFDSFNYNEPGGRPFIRAFAFTV
jgi:hypothetical protein